MGRLTPMRRLYPLRVPRTSALPAASSGFSVARDTLAVRLTFPLTGHVEDFHLRVGAPCRAHQKKRRAFGARRPSIKTCVLIDAFRTSPPDAHKRSDR